MEIYEFTLDMVPHKNVYPVIIHCSQYDVGRPYLAHLLYNGDSYTIQSGSHVYLNERKPDNTIYSTEITYSENGDVFFELEEQMAPVDGVCYMEISIVGGGQNPIGSANFQLWVEESVLDGGVESESIISQVQTAVNAAAQAIQYADNAAASADEAELTAQGLQSQYNAFTTQVEQTMTDAFAEQDASITSQVAAKTAEQVEQMQIREGQTVIDATLTVSGAAADAKKTGTEISQLKNDFIRQTFESYDSFETSDSDWAIGGINANGNEFNANYVIRTGYFLCYTGMKYSCAVAFTPTRFVVFYDTNHNFLSRQNITTNFTDVPTNARFMRFAIGYASSSGTDIDATRKAELISGFNANVQIVPVYNDEYITDKVGAMLAIAEGYFDKSYQDHKLIYQAQHGLFSENVLSDISGYEDCFAINCSQLATALAKGITWDNSRYALGADAINHMQPWGYMTDGSGVYQSELARELDYMWASEMYRYAENHGYPTYTITADNPMVRPGDFVFSTQNESDMYNKITHVALVVSVSYDNKQMQIIEANDGTDSDGNKIGVLLRNVNCNAFVYGAVFPIRSVRYKSRLFLRVTKFPDTPVTAGTIWTRAISIPSGFYTVVVRGTIMRYLGFGVIYQGETSRTYTTMCFNGDIAICVLYLTKPVTQIALIRDTGTEFNLDSIEIYKGYKQPDVI